MAKPSKDAPAAAAVVRAACQPLVDDHDIRRITGAVGHASFVLLGEATHGTHDFYTLRARITQELIEEHGFSAVTIEGDWPDAYRDLLSSSGSAGLRLPVVALSVSSGKT